VVSPDAGGVKRAKSVADKLQVDLAIIHKERKKANEVETMTLVGDVTGKVCLIIDDMADTCGTMAKAAETLLKSGGTKIYAFASHGVLSGPAVKTIENSALELLVVTNSIALSPEARACKKIHVLDVAPIFAEAIRRTHNGESISVLFTQDE